MNSVSNSGNMSCRVVYLPINVTLARFCRQFYCYVCFANYSMIKPIILLSPLLAIHHSIKYVGLGLSTHAIRLLLFCSKFTLICFLLGDGSWNSWGEWGDCSVTCGDGVKTRIRTCTNPPPNDGGNDCVGDSSSETSACSTTNCPGTVLITVRSTRYRSL